jgi:hypothetical protein
LVKDWLNKLDIKKLPKSKETVEKMHWIDHFFEWETRYSRGIKVVRLIKKIVDSPILDWDNTEITLKENILVNDSVFTSIILKDDHNEVIINWRYNLRNLKFFVLENGKLVFVCKKQKDLVDFFSYYNRKKPSYIGYLSNYAKGKEEKDLLGSEVLPEEKFQERMVF